MISDSAQSILSNRANHAQARDVENFITARDIARQKYGIDWPTSGGFYVLSARDMVIEVTKK